MTVTIRVTHNGDVDGIGVICEMNDYHAHIEGFLAKHYPGARISVTGDSRTSGGNSASISIEDEDGDDVTTRADKRILSDLMDACYSAACDTADLWQPVGDDE